MPDPKTSLVVVRRCPALEEAAEQLIASRKTPNTRTAYTSDWRRWLAFGWNRNIDLAAPNLVETVAFRDDLEKRFAAASVTRNLSTLSFFYRAFMAAGLVRVNPFDRSWLPRPDGSTIGKTQAIASDTATRILAAISVDQSKLGARDFAIMSLFVDTGLRRASIANLRRSDIDMFRLHACVIVKGGREKFCSFTVETGDAITRWLAVAPDSPYLFPSSRHPFKPIDLSTLNRIVGARALAVNARGVHPHQFRAAFITDGYDAGIPERDLQEAAHHADAAMTRRYDRGVRGERVVDRIAAYRKGKRDT